MKPFVAACVVAVLIAVASGLLLTGVQVPVDQAFATSAVRL